MENLDCYREERLSRRRSYIEYIQPIWRDNMLPFSQIYHVYFYNPRGIKRNIMTIHSMWWCGSLITHTIPIEDVHTSRGSAQCQRNGLECMNMYMQIYFPNNAGY